MPSHLDRREHLLSEAADEEIEEALSDLPTNPLKAKKNGSKSTSNNAQLPVDFTVESNGRDFTIVHGGDTSLSSAGEDVSDFLLEPSNINIDVA